jgi:hypothetical protein
MKAMYHTQIENVLSQSEYDSDLNGYVYLREKDWSQAFLIFRYDSITNVVVMDLCVQVKNLDFYPSKLVFEGKQYSEEFRWVIGTKFLTMVQKCSFSNSS